MLRHQEVARRHQIPHLAIPTKYFHTHTKTKIPSGIHLPEGIHVYQYHSLAIPRFVRTLLNYYFLFTNLHSTLQANAITPSREMTKRLFFAPVTRWK